MFIYAIFDTERANSIIKACRYTNRVFMGFISGKIIDSAIIGVLCYIITSILGTPYAVLVSVIVGVTNVIPVSYTHLLRRWHFRLREAVFYH